MNDWSTVRVLTSIAGFLMIFGLLGATTFPVPRAEAQSLPELSFDPGEFSVLEGEGLSLTVRLSVAQTELLSFPITVHKEGGASAEDYSLSATILFFPGQTIKPLVLRATDDEYHFEEGEKVRLVLDVPAGFLGDEITVTIVDTDDPTSAELDDQDVVWTSPSSDSWGSMPIGNGNIGLNVWVENSGARDLLFYIGTGDAYDRNGELLKLGRVRVALNPNPFASGATFSQRLSLRRGEIQITASTSSTVRVELVIWVDANNPVIHIKGSTSFDADVGVALELWRTDNRNLTGDELPRNWQNAKNSNRPFVDIERRADTIESGSSYSDRVMWYHWNRDSLYDYTLQVEELDDFEGDDPLLNQIFGAAILGDGMTRHSSRNWLLDVEDTRDIDISIHPHTGHHLDPSSWRSALQSDIDGLDDYDDRYAAHKSWWLDYWRRHWIMVSADGADAADAATVSQNYALSRFLLGASTRGDQSAHFNGLIFTVDVNKRLPHRFIDDLGDSGKRYDADYRTWGSFHWFQNIRFAYWPLLVSGDTEFMHSLFDMYLDAWPLAKFRTRTYFDHDGAYFPETITGWGSAAPRDYGTNGRGNSPAGWTVQPHKRYHWEGNIELVAMMLDYFDMTRDEAWLGKTIGFMHDIVTFFREHYSEDGGAISITPSQGLETLRSDTENDQAIVNPTDKVAGLHFILDRLLALPEHQVTEVYRQYWVDMKSQLPLIKKFVRNSKELIAASDSHSRATQDKENVPLYATFPFRVYGVGRPDLQLARNSFDGRRSDDMGGWNQQPIHATMTGDLTDAKNFTVRYFKEKEMFGPSPSISQNAFRFPIFYGPSHDYIPNVPQIGNAMISLQNMLVQFDGRRILLFPVWPREWNVKFRVHLPDNTTVTGMLQDGEVTTLTTSPAARGADIDLLNFEPDPESEPVVSFDSPVEGGVFDWSRGVEFSVSVTDTDSQGDSVEVDCAQVAVVAYLVRAGAASERRSRSSGCSGTVTIIAEPSDSADDELLYRLDASYTDDELLTGTSSVTLHPARKQAEDYDIDSGVIVQTRAGEAEGDDYVGEFENGDYFGFSDINLSGVTSIDIRFANRYNQGPAKIQVRTGSETGHLVGEVTVPVTGSWITWQTITISTLDDPGGTNDLYFVGVNTSSGRSGIGNVDYIEFDGDGITTDPPESEPVVSFDSPVEGGVFDWSRGVEFSVSVTDTDSQGDSVEVDCTQVAVVAYLVRAGAASEESRSSGCSGTVTIIAEPSDPADDELLYRLDASYTDNELLTDTSSVTLHPARKQAEDYDIDSGVIVQTRAGQAEGDDYVGEFENGDYFGFSDINLSGVTSIDIRFANRYNQGTAKIQVRTGSETGHLVGEVTVPVTGSWITWQTITISTLDDPGGTNDLYFVGVNTSSGLSGIGNVDYIEFDGDGITTAS